MYVLGEGFGVLVKFGFEGGGVYFLFFKKCLFELIMVSIRFFFVILSGLRK